MSRLAWTDSLTGALNRHRFLELAQVELKRSKREGASLTLLMIDVDHFKQINDNYGHAVGDDVLKTLAARWRTALRDHDLLGRLGGDEFVALLSGPSAREAETVAQRLYHSTTAKPFQTGGFQIPVKLSVGIAVFTDDTASLSDFLARADAALYAAKAAGRNRIDRHVA